MVQIDGERGRREGGREEGGWGVRKRKKETETEREGERNKSLASNSF